MTFSDLYSEGLTRELGSADTTQLFKTVRRKAAINSAQLEFVKQTECFTREVSIPTVDNTREYDLDAVGIISAEDYLWIASQGVEYAFTDSNGNVTYAAGDDFQRVDVEDLNREQSGWRGTTKTEIPQSWYLREEGGSVNLGLHPPPEIGAGESGAIRVPYVAIPPDMTNDAHEPFSVVMGTSPKRRLRPWHYALVHYAAALLEPLRKDKVAEQRQRALFASFVADYLQRQRPKGGQTVRLARNYYREARRGGVFTRAIDPEIWP